MFSIELQRISQLSKAKVSKACYSTSRPFVYRDFTHVLDIFKNFRLSFIYIFLNSFNILIKFFKRSFYHLAVKLSRHFIDSNYRVFTHIFTVLSPMFLGGANKLSLKALEQHKQQSKFQRWLEIKTTVFSYIKVPCFESLTYRAFNHRPTVLSPTFFGLHSVLSIIKAGFNTVRILRNQACKDELKDELKKIISFDVDSFFEKGRATKVYG